MAPADRGGYRRWNLNLARFAVMLGYIFPMAAIRAAMRVLDIKSSADAKAHLWQCLGK